MSATLYFYCDNGFALVSINIVDVHKQRNVWLNPIASSIHDLLHHRVSIFYSANTTVIFNANINSSTKGVSKGNNFLFDIVHVNGLQFRCFVFCIIHIRNHYPQEINHNLFMVSMDVNRL